jgi:uncharacterized protein
MPATLRKIAIRFFVTLAGIVLLMVLGVGGLFYVAQEKLVFQLTVLPATHAFNLPLVSEVTIAVDGATLSALHYKHTDSKGIIFFLHGNAGSLDTWLATTEFYRRNRLDVFMIDYRGYGKSTGEIKSEAQLYADVRAAWDLIAPQYAGKPRVIFGRSLGTTLATKLSTEVDADWTVLVSPFYNLEAMRQQHYPWLPRALMRYKFTTNEWLPSIKNSVTVIRGNIDTLINISQAKRLKAIAPKVEHIEIPEGDHVNLHLQSTYLDAMANRLIKL